LCHSLLRFILYWAKCGQLTLLCTTRAVCGKIMLSKL